LGDVKNSVRSFMKQFRVLDPKLPAQVSPGLCALAVMTKAPQAGRVKTRLVPPLTPDQAAELNKCFLRDTAAAISGACCRRPVGDANEVKQSAVWHREVTRAACGIAVYTPVGSEQSYDDILPADFFLLPQRGDGFGERLYFATEDLFACGFASVCLIDSDSPTIPTLWFHYAADLLAPAEDRIVLGPSDDGGYYLIGLTKPHREIFEEIDWSTERVLEQTIRRATQIGVEVKLLPTGYDIDDGANLRRLCHELLAQPSNDSVAPSTRRFLATLTEGEKTL
jgi:rSAM/selenodomain-associated transferase 1